MELEVELEVDEDGGLRIFMSRLSDSLQSADPARNGECLLTSGAVTYARQFIALTTTADHADYLGNWILAAGATGPSLPRLPPDLSPGRSHRPEENAAAGQGELSPAWRYYIGRARLGKAA